MKIIWSPQAGKDLLDIYQRIAADNPGAARRLHEKIVSRIQDVGLMPQIGRAGRVPGTRELVIAGTPYTVPYRVRGEVLHILRFYHASRLWPEVF
ncbi:MAG: type II toxin-antitoxin system RelE/ParE family toxin [Syntrophobacteraceae bacterium]|nr:type II toxin-antitoxin system RelE/ParE family toxin [Syntrophobacteraceae bacterium]